MYYVYILKLSNGDLYKGSTHDLKRRMKEHTNGKVISTKSHRPLKLIGYEAYEMKSDAVSLRVVLKNYRRTEIAETAI